MNQTPLHILKLLLTLLLLMPATGAAAQTDELDNIDQPRQKLTHIKRNSGKYFFREARYGDAICPRDTALLVVFTEFLIDVNERRMQDHLPQINLEAIRQMVSQIDVNYGSYNRIVIYCQRSQVLPKAGQEAPATPAGSDAPAVAAASDAPAVASTSAAPGGPELSDAPAQSSVSPPLPADVLKDLAGIESYRDFTQMLQELYKEKTVSIMGMLPADTDHEAQENYIAIFSRADNQLKAIIEPLSDHTYRNTITLQPDSLGHYNNTDYKRIYFR